MIIAPSVLSLDYSKFNEQLDSINKNTNMIHFDVMDGNFVPNLSFGPSILKTYRKNSSLYLDVHLMVNNPRFFVDTFADCGADGITFHVESLNNDYDKCVELLKYIKSRYLKAGITFKPNTSIDVILPLLEYCDLVLVMSVEPGFSGQHFINESYEKIRTLNEYRENNNLNYLIEVDGGINDKNAYELSNSGADILVSGSYVFNGDIESNINKLKHSCK